MTVLTKAKTAAEKVKRYWRTPPEGNFMTYKEIASLAGGGIGVKFIITFVQSVLISVGNVFVGNTIGIKPGPMYVIYIISVLAGFPLTALRANIVDNTRNRKGKYRPYIISMGLPTVLLSLGYVWAPYEHMNNIGKYATVLFFNIGFQFFYYFLLDAYDNYVVVLSSNTQERANVAAIRAVTDSLAPSITNIIIPIAGRAITGSENLFDIRIYRFVWPPVLILGFFISLIVYVNTKEKIIQARTHVVQIKFVDAFRAVFKNKYFWIISMAGWLGFLETMTFNILSWLYTYQHACDAGTYALIWTLYGNASFWGMLAAPICIKKIGKKNTLVLTNVMNIFFLAAMYPIARYVDPGVMIWPIMACMWMNAMVNAFSHILTPSINGDIRDYQQYVTGERIDGMFAAVGLIGSVIAMLTTSVQSIIYSRIGFNDAKLKEVLPAILASGQKIDDLTNVYNVLYHRETFISIFGVLVLFSVLGAAMNVVPYFFYDLSETKQRGMVRVLQLRALFEDYGKGVLSDSDLVKAIDLVNESRRYLAEQPIALENVKAAYRGRQRRKEKAKAVEHNRMIEVSQFVIDEMNRFETPQGKAQLAEAEKIAVAGFDHIFTVSKADLAKARILPTDTPQAKEYRKAEIQRIKDCLYAQRVAKKHFPNGIEEFDSSEFDELFRREDETDEAIDNAYKAYYEAKDARDRDKVIGLTEQLKQLKEQRKLIERDIKTATDKNSVYHRVAKPYLDAKKLLTQSENYSRYDDIAAQYEAALQRKQAEEASVEE
ncbi:MAG: MFS transporter [Clostridia bacterium]|nr:MFS transporter [Clostridia bacterium]